MQAQSAQEWYQITAFCDQDPRMQNATNSRISDSSVTDVIAVVAEQGCCGIRYLQLRTLEITRSETMPLSDTKGRGRYLPGGKFGSGALCLCYVCIKARKVDVVQNAWYFPLVAVINLSLQEWQISAGIFQVLQMEGGRGGGKRGLAFQRMGFYL